MSIHARVMHCTKHILCNQTRPLCRAFSSAAPYLASPPKAGDRRLRPAPCCRLPQASPPPSPFPFFLGSRCIARVPAAVSAPVPVCGHWVSFLPLREGGTFTISGHTI